MIRLSFYLALINLPSLIIRKRRKSIKKNQDQKNSTPATRDNTIEGEKKKGDKKCFNYLKKCYYIRNCLEPLKN